MGAEDRACHAFNNKKTKRNDALFHPGGTAYVYLCYGIHHLFNIVTHKVNYPHSLLIRSIVPFHNSSIMLQRCQKNMLTNNILNGPGLVSKAYGITTKLNKERLYGPKIWIEESNVKIKNEDVLHLKRVGINFAMEAKNYLYRLKIKRNVFI